jgi:hypothetical protein
MEELSESTSTPGDAAPATPTSGPKPVHSDPVLAKLMAPDSAYWKKDAPGNVAARTAVADRFRELYGDEPDDSTAVGAADDDALRRSVGVEVNLPKQYESDFNRFDADVFYHYVRDEQIPTVTAQSLVDWVINTHVFSAGKPDIARALEEFESKYANDLTPHQRRTLVRWYLNERG